MSLVTCMMITRLLQLAAAMLCLRGLMWIGKKRICQGLLSVRRGQPKSLTAWHPKSFTIEGDISCFPGSSDAEEDLWFGTTFNMLQWQCRQYLTDMEQCSALFRRKSASWHMNWCQRLFTIQLVIANKVCSAEGYRKTSIGWSRERQ